MREMQSPEGGYYSSLDADSEGVEGKFYVWDREEVRALLSPDEYGAFASRYGLDRAPNFEDKHWHLVLAREPAGDPGKSRADPLVASARAKVFAAREKRIRPGRDE